MEKEIEQEKELLQQAIDIFSETGTQSVSLLQRRLKISYNKARGLLDQIQSRELEGASAPTEEPSQEESPEKENAEESKPEETTDPASVQTMGEIQREVDLAKEKNWHRLGMFYLELTQKLPEARIIEIATSQSEHLMEIETLEMQKKAFDAEINGKIKALQAAAIGSAKEIRNGEFLDSRHWPAFFDPETKERVFWDFEKSEELKRLPAQPNDYQTKLDLDKAEEANLDAEPSQGSEIPVSESQPEAAL